MEDSVSEEREVCFCTKVQVVCVDSRSVDSSSQDQVGGVQVGGGRVMLFSIADGILNFWGHAKGTEKRENIIEHKIHCETNY